MTTYYTGPRVRLPSNRSLQLSDSSSPSPASRTDARPSDFVLVFPAPSSEPASPHPQLHSRHPLRLRHTRVDSNASRIDSNTSRVDSADLSSRPRVDSNASSLSITDVSSARFARSASEWEDLAVSPLTRERVVRLGSARMIPSSGSVEVEMWEWTSTGSEVGEEETETKYEDALSQFHLPTLEESRWVAEARRPEAVAGVRPVHRALERRVRLPFRFLLETVLGIDRGTLMLLERGSHEPESISETGLFGVAMSVDEGAIAEVERTERRVLALGEDPVRMVKRGLDALADVRKIGCWLYPAASGDGWPVGGKRR